VLTKLNISAAKFLMPFGSKSAYSSIIKSPALKHNGVVKIVSRGEITTSTALLRDLLGGARNRRCSSLFQWQPLVSLMILALCQLNLLFIVYAFNSKLHGDYEDDNVDDDDDDDEMVDMVI